MPGQAKPRPAPFPRAPRGHCDIWLVGFARKTDTHEAETIYTKGRRKRGAAGSSERRGCYKVTQQPNRFPESRGPPRPASRATQCACQQPRGPFLRTARQGGRPVTAALPGAGGKGPSPGGSARPLRPGAGARRPSACRFPLSATTHSPAPTPGRERSGALRPRHRPQRGPAPLPARPPARPDAPTPGSDTHQSRRRRRLLLAPRSLGSQLPRRRRRLRDTDPGLFKITRPAPFHRRIP